ncbi:hypothetical protein [Mesomycoplasma hyopneumoniae]|nr:hypothetical protein [Mesomycoplasma hyopneumoniae]
MEFEKKYLHLLKLYIFEASLFDDAAFYFESASLNIFDRFPIILH